ncbi:amidase [Epibacterium sp. SM1969]|uniref:Amidase n=1 Tax=Tritonibacter aquimaris TaxID=2663379 RepID=A0A844B0C8_9RHOB|nr:amidase [Tritonibacter aquimaris]MQY44004.1 amidase [Tritonibacter aquimaris]
MTVAKQDNRAVTRHLDLGADGLTVMVKDCIDIKGEITTCGSAALAGNAPANDHADVVAALLDAGCHIVGKTNMHELAFGMTGANVTFGTPVNPRWPDRIPGGSSSGSAVAVAAGQCDFALGTDTGGSVRQPAICCGIYGIKPSFGRVSRAGCTPAYSSLDCVGVFARSAPMLSRGMAAIDPSFTTKTLPTAPRLARIKSKVDPALGDELIYALMEGLPNAAYLTLPSLDAAFDAGMTIIAHETAVAFGYLLDQDAPLGADIKQRLTAACEVSQQAIAQAEDIRARFTTEVDAALDQYDALITPALPVAPPTWDQAKDPAAILPLTRLLRPFNLSGHPALVMPIAQPRTGLPAGIQLVGRKGADEHLCAIAEWMAATLPAFQQEEDQ